MLNMSISSLLTAIWFIVFGVTGLLPVMYSGLILSVLAIIIGILIFAKK